MEASHSDDSRPENTKIKLESNLRFYYQMELANASANATAATGRTKKDTTGSVKKGTKKGRSKC